MPLPEFDVPRLEGFLTVPEVATLLAVSKQAVHKMIGDGRITGVVRVGETRPVYLVKEAAVQAVLEARQPLDEASSLAPGQSAWDPR
jgi:excisionase family DNA binding protein